jgi:hypothetical protein
VIFVLIQRKVCGITDYVLEQLSMTEETAGSGG